ncbi:MAG: hypothetical protein AB8H03_17715 [Saprospiraceae bacterium]
MSDFWKKIKNVFSAAEASSSIHPTIHEIIERSEEELMNYEQWKNSLVARRLIDWLKNEYFTYLTSPKNIDRSIEFLNSTSKKGFVIHFSRMQYRLEEITFLFDYLKEKVKELPYRIYVSDTRTYPKNDFVETIHRHYLKPSLKLKVAGQKAGQAFGNITIEMLLKNDEIVDLKFSATTYRDHQFKEAGDFNELMREVIS